MEFYNFEELRNLNDFKAETPLTSSESNEETKMQKILKSKQKK